MRQTTIIPAFAMLVVSAFAIADDDTKPDVLNPIPAPGDQISKSGQPSQEATQLSADERAIRASANAYVKAFNEGNASAAAAVFTPEGEFIDASDNRFVGRPAIENLLKEFFAENPGCKLELTIESIRQLAPELAVEDGTSRCTNPDGSMPHFFRYSAIHVKEGGKWLTASARDRSYDQPRQHAAHLQQFNWMVGEWVHEGDDSIVRFSCHPVDNNNFLMRKFTVMSAGKQVMSGSQRIGWDAQAGKFRSWIFDSDGGYADGYWHRDGDNWILNLSGVTADGKTASATSVYSIVDSRTITYQSTNHEVGGVELPDSAPVTIVREISQPDYETSKR